MIVNNTDLGYTAVRWHGKKRIVIRSTVTGNKYYFAGYGSVVAVDNKDVKLVLRYPKMIAVG